MRSARRSSTSAGTTIAAAVGSRSGGSRAEVIQEALGRPRRVSLSCRHTPPEKFRPGQPLKIELAVEKPVSVRLYYRHVNQAERWESVEMHAQDGRYGATLAGSYTDSNYPLQYYFELKERPDAGSNWMPRSRQLISRPSIAETRTVSIRR